MDPRLDVRALGAVHARLRLGGQRLLLVHRRHRRAGRRAAGHVPGRRRAATCSESTLDHLQRLRGRPAGAHRQRRRRAAPARRVGRGARLGVHPHPLGRPARRAAVADPPAPGRVGDRATGASPTRASGRCGASRSTSRPRRSCAGWRSTAARGWPASAATTSWPRSGRPRPRRSTPTSAPTRSTSGACSPSTTTPTASTPRCCSCRSLGFLPADDERVRTTVLAIADELTVDGLVLRYRVEETDDGLCGEEGTFTICSFWLVSALALIGENERAEKLCEKLLSMASPLGLYAEEIDPSERPAPRQLPAGVHPPRAHQRGDDPRRPAGAAPRSDAADGGSVRGRCPPPRSTPSPRPPSRSAPTREPQFVHDDQVAEADRPASTGSARATGGRAEPARRS